MKRPLPLVIILLCATSSVGFAACIDPSDNCTARGGYRDCFEPPGLVHPPSSVDPALVGLVEDDAGPSMPPDPGDPDAGDGGGS